MTNIIISENNLELVSGGKLGVKAAMAIGGVVGGACGAVISILGAYLFVVIVSKRANKNNIFETKADPYLYCLTFGLGIPVVGSSTALCADVGVRIASAIYKRANKK